MNKKTVSMLIGAGIVLGAAGATTQTVHADALSDAEAAASAQAQAKAQADAAAAEEKQAQAAYDAAANDQKDAENTAKAEADSAVSKAQAEVNKGTTALEQAKQEQSDAQAAVADAAAAKDAADKAYENAQASAPNAETAKTEYEQAQKAADDAEVDAEAKKEAYDSANEAALRARHADEDAEHAASAADSAVEMAKDAETKGKAVADQQKIVDEASAKTDAKQKEINSKQQDISAKAREVAEKKSDYDKAVSEQTKLISDNAASLGIDPSSATADEVYEKAVEKAAEAKKALEDAESNKTAVEEASKDAVTKKAEGSFGYFKSRGHDMQSLLDMAEKYSYTSTARDEHGNLITKTVAEYTQMGADGDATSLENMMRALDILREINTMRTTDDNFMAYKDDTHHLAPFKVTDYVMAVSQLRANMAQFIMGHTHWTQMGENLAYGYSDPAVGWYTEEKAKYDSGVRVSKEIGHYLQITDYFYQSAGLGVCTKDGASPDYGTYCSLGFSDEDKRTWNASDYKTGTTTWTSDPTDTGVDFDTYYNDFKAYYDGVMNGTAAIRDADDAVTAAQNANTAAQALVTALNNVKSRIASTYSTYTTAKGELDTLNSQLDTLKTEKVPLDTALSGARNTLSEKQNAYNQSVQKYRNAVYSYDLYGGEREREGKGMSEAQRIVYAESLQANASAKKTSTSAALSDAQKKASDAKAAYEAAVKQADILVDTASKKKAAYDAAKANAGTVLQAKTDAEHASQVLADAQSYLTVANEKVSTLTDALADAEGALQDAQAVKNELDAYLKGGDGGERYGYLAQKRDAARKAGDVLVSAKSRNHAARAAYNNAATKVEQANAAYQNSITEMYRLYNPNSGEHFYTASAAERDFLDSIGWNYEGIGWYSDGRQDVPLYRQYNPNARTGSHNYTTSKQENDFLASVGWNAEGIGWYGSRSTTGITPGARLTSVEKGNVPIVELLNLQVSRPVAKPVSVETGSYTAVTVPDTDTAAKAVGTSVVKFNETKQEKTNALPGLLTACLASGAAFAVGAAVEERRKQKNV